jgi:hypothetical protein
LSKEDKHIDNLFKEKLDGRSFDGPPAEFLADLNQRLDKKPVVSRGWIWVLFLNLLIIGLLIANTTIDFPTTKTAEVEPQIENKELLSKKGKSNKSEIGESKSTSVNSDEAEVKNTKQAERFSNTKVNSDEFESNKTETNATESSGVRKSQTHSEGINSNSQAGLGKQNQSSETAKSESRKNSGNNRSSGNDDTSNTTSGANNKDSNQASKNSNDSRISQGEEKLANKESKDDKKVAKENGEVAKKDNTTSNKTTTPRNSLASLPSYVSFSAIYAPEFDEINRKITTKNFPEFTSQWNEIIADDNNETSKEIPEQEEEKEKISFELQLQGGAMRWGFKTLGTNDTYVNVIDQSGTPKWTPSFGLAFHSNFNRISIGTGVDYAKFKTENLFEFGEVSTYDSTYVAGYNPVINYDSLGNVIDTTYTPYYDSTTVTDTTYNTNIITNEYEWIQIPLHIGYRFNLNQWAIIPRVGMNIGLGIRQSTGQYPNEAYDGLQTLTPVKWHLNLHTSLEVRREFGNWHAFGKFNYQRNLTPTIDNTLFERKFNGIGFNFGIGYSF